MSAQEKPKISCWQSSVAHDNGLTIQLWLVHNFVGETEMSVLSNLKLVAAKKPAQLSPVVQRRNKVVRRLAEQIALATAKQDGKTYAPTKQRTVKDAATGESKTISVSKFIKEWWFVTTDNKLCVSLRYGAKIVELAKGKTAVELATADQLVPTLETLKTAVIAGELDAQLEAVSAKVKAGFKK